MIEVNDNGVYDNGQLVLGYDEVVRYGVNANKVAEYLRYLKRYKKTRGQEVHPGWYLRRDFCGRWEVQGPNNKIHIDSGRVIISARQKSFEKGAPIEAVCALIRRLKERF